MSHLDAKIQRLVIPCDTFSIIWTISKFYEIPSFSLLGEVIYKIKIIPWLVIQVSCLVMVVLLKEFFWYYSHRIVCHLVTVLPILFTLNWNLLLFAWEIIARIIFMIRGFLLSWYKIHTNTAEWYVP